MAARRAVEELSRGAGGAVKGGSSGLAIGVNGVGLLFGERLFGRDKDDKEWTGMEWVNANRKL
jgi:hypothetical protein